MLLISLWFSPTVLFGQNYQLVFADEFDGTEVDLSNWTLLTGDGTDVGLPPGWGNNELQWYQSDNATVNRGFLTITAREESVSGYNYTSSRMITANKQDFTYGKFEMRAKMPIGQGLWPAYWMFFTGPGEYGGWAASGEIDIMEYIGSEPQEVFGTLHYGQPFPGNVFSSIYYELPSGTFNDDFHTFTVEWEPGEMRWFVDDILYATQNTWWSNGGPYPAPFDQDFHLLLNLAVGGNLPGNPDASTVFPQEYVIDYVRAYQDVDLPTVTITSPMPAASLTEGALLTITADATAPNGVSKVEFFQGEKSLGVDETVPFEASVVNVAAGSYRLRAVVTDNNGKRNFSDFVAITVGSGGAGPYGIAASTVPGRIETENYDVGGNGLAYADNDPQVNQGSRTAGNLYRSDEGVDLENTADTGGGQNVAFTNNGEFLTYTIDVPTAGNYDVVARVASESGGSLLLLFDDEDKTGPFTFDGTGGFQSWIDVKKEDVPLAAGKQVLKLEFLSNNINVNYLELQSADPSSGSKVTFDDMEHGDPINNKWFVFGGSVGGGGIDPNSTDLPPSDGGAFSLQTGWGSGGVPGFLGGFGRTNPVDLSATDHFNFWINADADQDFVLEINLQDDDDGDDNIDSSSDDEFQYNLTVGPESNGAEVVSGGGWQLISIPLADFFDDNSNLIGGNGILDATPVSGGGNGQLINVVMAIITNSGADATFRTDFWSFTSGPLGASLGVSEVAIDFEEVALTRDASRAVILQNEGGSDLTISSISTSNSVFNTSSLNLPLVLKPGATAQLLVSFAPEALGVATGDLVIASTDNGMPIRTVALSGVGVEPPLFNFVVFDDIEHGDPANNGWFAFDGVSAGGVSADGTSLPPEDGGAFSLATSWGAGNGFLGGYGRVNLLDLSDMTHFNMWINPGAGESYTLEINLQDDDNGDNDIPFPSPDDDEFQYNLTVGPSGSGADVLAGGGWQFVSIPFADFFDDNSIHIGNGIFDPVPTSAGGNGQLVNVIFAIISDGQGANYLTDFIVFSEGPYGVTDPDIEVAPASLNFGVVTQGGTSIGSATVTNSGGGTLEITAASTNDPQFVVTTALPVSLTSGQSADIEVAFSPSAFGVALGELEIVSNDIDENPVIVPLKGEGSDLNKVIFDDMEHGDPFGNGWFAFNGAVGGGGLAPNPADLAPTNQGNFSLQTGWGSGGNAGFYGGFGRANTVNIEEMTHFNFWINPDAGQDYLLEINLQDDDNDDGNLDDEFQYNLTVNEVDGELVAGGKWQLVSLPLAEFFDDNSFLTGGDGELSSTIANIVFAVIGSGSDVNFRTDFWCFSDKPLRAELVFDDMEHGDPFGNGWFTFGGAVGGGGIDPNAADLPPQDAGAFSLQTGWGSGGNPGFFGGFGRTNPVHIADMTHFNMWINPDADQDYLLEINLQEDDDGDNAFPFPAPNDDEFQFNLEVGPNGKHGISGGGWQLISLPLDAFFDDNSIHGGNGIFDPVPVGSGGNGQLIGIVVTVISNSGADVNFRTDYWSFTDGPLEGTQLIVDPTALDFGAVSVGATEVLQVELRNDGIANLGAPDALFTGSGAFSIVGDLAAIPGGGSQIVDVAFEPMIASPQVLSGHVEFLTKLPVDLSHVVALSGSGKPVAPQMQLLLADDDIKIDGPRYFRGEIHANDDVELGKGDPSIYVGNITAVDDVKIKGDNIIQGDVSAGDRISLDKKSEILGARESHADVAEIEVSLERFMSGRRDIVVKKKKTRMVAPGVYDDLKAERESTIKLESGTYFFDDFSVEKEANLMLDISSGPVIVNVRDDAKFKKESSINAPASSDNQSLFFTLNVLDKVDIEREVQFEGSIVAPNDDVKIDKEVLFRGSITGEDIRIGKESSLIYHGEPQMEAKAIEPVDSVEMVATTEEAIEAEEPVKVLSADKALTIYPNPSEGILNISLQSEGSSERIVRLYDNWGRMVFTSTIEENIRQTMDLRRLPDGLYLLVVKGNERTYRSRIVLNR